MLFFGEKMEEDEIKEVLIQQDETFRQLYRQHQEMEQSLLKLREKGLLTGSEELAEKELKKRKLKLKDEIYQRIVIYKEKVESHE